MDTKTNYNNYHPFIPIPIGFELLIQIPSLNLRIKSVLIGMEHDHYIIAKIFNKDLIGNLRSPTLQNSDIEVMYLHKDIIYHFDTKILNLVTTPARLLILEYPKMIESRGLCIKTRHGCFIPAQTMLENHIIEMSIVDLSNEGCLCVIDTNVEKGKKIYRQIQVQKKIEILVTIPETNERLKLPGIIRNISKDDSGIKIGVMFSNIDSSVQKKIADFVDIVQAVQMSQEL